jgi:tRNA A37 threonylcarbamoyladenosine dehydratase
METKIGTFAIGALVGGILAVICVEKFRKVRVKDSHIPSNPKIKTSTPATATLNYPEEIPNELYSRSVSFFGADKFKDVQEAFIIVVGLGGVGSHAANMLARIGVQHLRLIDFDQVSLSSLNRNALSTLQDVGISKVEAMKNRILEIIPWCRIEVVNEMFKGSNAAELLQGNPTYVLDCIDDISTKAALIAYCIENKIKVLTSMGAGGKADPTRVRIGTLKDCVRDPLAAKLKWKLHKTHEVVPDNVMAIYSSEKPPQDYGAVGRTLYINY